MSQLNFICLCLKLAGWCLCVRYSRLSENKCSIHNFFKNLSLCLENPQTRLEGVSANKAGQFAVVLEVGS